ncbi:IMP dehydrogenase [Mycobacterium sp. CBMA293]|uniref:IMP dehydrogenase n=1 Tax=unclassified Mycolicibacterium TaxID=2636767 RepID=UPI0012DD8C34|nr:MULTISPECIES: IMP dehydrogenase [unclassified Mycolicibacterium]MUL44443.1 IMP dehydrogenase [Mycolicibacterium sp. CBMA 360]MUL59763.1 IMP dehydrogenase [Mycolicibacterium sp. CBMA 335]MUL68606.1 IMP dehydrogenase [Mycolicibacterium sp. CBMA 311]MUL94003.1 IMP dehydrogenase [Mycolicibacterium sp. CBMA 230]MUM06249.1 inosine 5-monophosphate dehydrogenase [Mycolicibacterium sp. CBMA 213]
MAQIVEGISRTFNEFLLLPNKTSNECRADDVELAAPLARHSVGERSRLELQVPFTSAIMQAVSSPELAIALARHGGLSFLHHNRPITEQVADIEAVKAFKAGFVVSDTNVQPENALGELWEAMMRTGHNTVAVTADGSAHGRLLGLISSRDFHPHRHDLTAPVSSRMTVIDDLAVAESDITLTEANARLWDERLDCLPVVDTHNRLQHLVFRSDYTDNKRHPHQLVDADKRLRVGAGVNTHDYRERVPALVDAGADALCLDSSDGYSEWQAHALDWVKTHYPDVVIGAGNVVDGQAFEYLADAGADFVKIGVGGGSICITRDQKGIGRGQATAVLEVAAARDVYAQRTGQYVPVCSDGGLQLDYHVALALAMGADFVMMGRYFARFDQAPGAKVPTAEGYAKEYWGEGSHRARNWQRYEQPGTGRLTFEEGVDGFVPYAGDLNDGLALTIAKIKATMTSCGATTLRQFHNDARLTLVSDQSFQEAHASIDIRSIRSNLN